MHVQGDRSRVTVCTWAPVAVACDSHTGLSSPSPACLLRAPQPRHPREHLLVSDMLLTASILRSLSRGNTVTGLDIQEGVVPFASLMKCPEPPACSDRVMELQTLRPEPRGPEAPSNQKLAGDRPCGFDQGLPPAE